MSRSFEEVCIDLELAESEIDRLNELLDEATHDYFCDMNRRLAEARQEAARECLLLFYLALDESISFEETYIKGVKSIKAKFGLEE